ncbi:hypothetical protein [Metallosphaera hakonensis]|uniref:hypothetical protein n=1 Tax=Metallosphaera hakonensis TaxID=79601 RepID=UPI0020924084|nr:hypothetical protein [Metallosphaera hakonensis]
MKRVLRIPRFSKEGREGKPKTLELLMDSPTTNDKGFPQEAKLLLVIDDGKNRVGFQLNTAEAALLYQRLWYVLNETAKEYIQVEEKNQEKLPVYKKGKRDHRLRNGRSKRGDTARVF